MIARRTQQGVDYFSAKNSFASVKYSTHRRQTDRRRQIIRCGYFSMSTEAFPPVSFGVVSGGREHSCEPKTLSSRGLLTWHVSNLLPSGLVGSSYARTLSTLNIESKPKTMHKIGDPNPTFFRALLLLAYSRIFSLSLSLALSVSLSLPR